MRSTSSPSPASPPSTRRTPTRPASSTPPSAAAPSSAPPTATATSDVELPFITSWSSTLDPLNPLFDAFALLLNGDQDYENDGLVRAKDAQWGQFWGCLPADHVDEIGQILGEGPGVGNNWKYLDFYTQVIAYMRSQGY